MLGFAPLSSACNNNLIILRAIEGATRVVFGRKAVESGVRETRVGHNKSLDYLFEGKIINLKYKPKAKKDSSSEIEESTENIDDDGLTDIIRPAVVCCDPQELVYKIMMERNMDIDNTIVKVGADDGQGIFKINVQLLSKNPEVTEDNLRSTYSEVQSCT